jgi:hypothetical protein
MRRRYLTLPGRITRSARRTTLHLPVAWPWAAGFLAAVDRLHGLVQVAGWQPAATHPTAAGRRSRRAA